MKFLRFDFESSARVALAPWIEDGAWPAYIGQAAVDVVGELEDKAGFHVNLSERVAELEQFEIETPAEPERIFAGSDVPPQLSYPRFFGNQKLDLFTRAEQLAVVTATMSDPLVKLMYDRMIGAAYLSYEDPETEAGLSLLVGKGLLTPERKTEIVSLMQAS